MIGLWSLLPHKSTLCVEKSAGRNFRISIDLIYFAFHCNQFWLVSAIEIDYLCFSFGKAVIAGLLRLFTIISSIPKTNKNIHSNFKFENTHVLAINIIVNMLGPKKWKSTKCFQGQWISTTLIGHPQMRKFCCFPLIWSCYWVVPTFHRIFWLTNFSKNEFYVRFITKLGKRY